jgi:hypothetical protein
MKSMWMVSGGVVGLILSTVLFAWLGHISIVNPYGTPIVETKVVSVLQEKKQCAAAGGTFTMTTPSRQFSVNGCLFAASIDEPCNDVRPADVIMLCTMPSKLLWEQDLNF